MEQNQCRPKLLICCGSEYGCNLIQPRGAADRGGDGKAMARHVGIHLIFNGGSVSEYLKLTLMTDTLSFIVESRSL